MSSEDRDERIRPRLEEARRWFREHHAGIEPDPEFAARVVARLRRDPAEELGRAALRLLPATVALALVLIWVAVSVAPRASETQAATTDVDVVGWVYGETEATR